MGREKVALPQGLMLVRPPPPLTLHLLIRCLLRPLRHPGAFGAFFAKIFELGFR